MNWKSVLAALMTAAATQTAWATPWDQGRVVTGERAVLDHRARAAAENEILDDRLKTLLPRLMDEAGIDMWLVINREYAEDPVYLTLVPQPTFAARRTTMLMFHREGDALEMLTVSRYPLGGPYDVGWEGGALDAQWSALGRLIAEKNPDKIGVNISRDWPIADGLTHSLRERLVSVLTPELVQRLTSAEALVVRWAETRTAREKEIYSHAVGIARAVISEAFSSNVITPGVTKTDDVAWHIRQRFEDLNLDAWFMPYVNIQRPSLACDADQAFCGEEGGVIRHGDVLHTDVGICYLKVCTDTQEMAYVARPGEPDAPAGLKAALKTGNRWQDLLTSSFDAGLTGNQILAKARAKCRDEGIDCSIYTHPIGVVGHAPGPTIGMWDNQGDTPVRGDWPLHPDTCFAIEGNIKTRVPEWDDHAIQMKLEQSACFDGETVDYLAGRQTTWHVVR
ncbi:MAG: M24 family metallopeptidase [Pseudomonadota bacterium]